MLPLFCLLKSLYNSCDRLSKSRDVPEDVRLVNKSSCQSDLVEAWPVWIQHPGGVPLVSISYALLYFTALSPHGIPLTAFLASSGAVNPFHLAVFRGLGACAGILGLSTFEVVKGCSSLRFASSIHIWFEVVAVFVAAFSFSNNNVWLFMFAVVLSRVGLYGFDVGFMELQQRQVEEKARNAIGAVDNSLTSIATFALFAATLHVDSYESFSHVTWASAFSVLLASVIFSIYLCLWHEHEHAHPEGSEDVHAHTTQQLRALEVSRVHKHVHYTGFAALAPCSPTADMVDHGHSHSHDHSHNPI